MDPNKTLEDIMSVAYKWEEWGTLEMDPLETLDYLVENIVALHEWLSSGGHRPDSWR